MSLDRQTLTRQRVEAEEEEEELRDRAQTEAQEAVLEVVRRLKRATARMVAKELEGNSGTVWRQLNALWTRGLLQREASGKSFCYFVPNHNGNKEQPDEQLQFIKEPD